MCAEVVHVCNIYSVLQLYFYILKEVCLGLLKMLLYDQRKAEAVLCLVFANSWPEIQF